jgi:hypothetical protein
VTLPLTVLPQEEQQAETNPHAVSAFNLPTNKRPAKDIERSTNIDLLTTIASRLSFHVIRFQLPAYKHPPAVLKQQIAIPQFQLFPTLFAPSGNGKADPLDPSKPPELFPSLRCMHYASSQPYVHISIDTIPMVPFVSSI